MHDHGCDVADVEIDGMISALKVHSMFHTSSDQCLVYTEGNVEELYAPA